MFRTEKSYVPNSSPDGYVIFAIGGPPDASRVSHGFASRGRGPLPAAPNAAGQRQLYQSRCEEVVNGRSADAHDDLNRALERA